MDTMIGSTRPPIHERIAPISRQIWNDKYRLKAPDGTPVDLTIEDSWRRIASALAAVEAAPNAWERRFYEALEDFRFLPAGRIVSGAGTGRRVTLFNCFVMGDIADDLGSIFAHLREAALTMQQGGGIGYDFSTLRPKGAALKTMSGFSGSERPLSVRLRSGPTVSRPHPVVSCRTAALTAEVRAMVLDYRKRTSRTLRNSPVPCKYIAAVRIASERRVLRHPLHCALEAPTPRMTTSQLEVGPVMPEVREEIERVLGLMKASRKQTFTTFEFINRFKAAAPRAWATVEQTHGTGGKGAGRHYSAFSRISQFLHRVTLAGGLTKLDYVKAPNDWGAPGIRVWSFDPNEQLNVFPEDQDEGEDYWEGAVTQILVNRYERNARARRSCIDHYGAKCLACGIDFGDRYGEHGKGFIHVHHLLPLHKIAKAYKVDGVKDMRPVCPNCHAMIHCRAQMLTLARLKKIMRS